MTGKRVHALVSGRVQGVGFRASTKRRATELGLNGWVRNLDDGRVEFVAQGAEQAVDALVEWAHRGPSSASVDRVEVEQQPASDANEPGFTTRN